MGYLAKKSFQRILAGGKLTLKQGPPIKSENFTSPKHGVTSGTNWEHAHKWFVKSVKIKITITRMNPAPYSLVEISRPPFHKSLLLLFL